MLQPGWVLGAWLLAAGGAAAGTGGAGEAGGHANGGWRAPDGGFERAGRSSSGLGGWLAVGDARALRGDQALAAYRGRAALELGRSGPGGAECAVSRDRDRGEALVPAVALWARASGARPVRLVVEWRNAAGEPLVSAARLVASAERFEWLVFEGVATSGAGPLVPAGPGGVLSVRADGPVLVDEVELGERAALTGNPANHAACNFVGWYRSPHFAGMPSWKVPSEIWRNWHWTQPPACDSAITAFAHDPECSSSPSCLRGNGRRDGAVGTFDGEDELPIFGTYDSRDPDLLRAQVELAEAIGFDSFVYLHHGETLAGQMQAQGREPLNAQTFEALLDVCDGPGRTLKVAVMYEPKVHFNGWVTGEPSKAQKLAGIEADLVHLAQTWGARKSALRQAGELVVYVFRNDVCNASGTHCMTDADWQAIADGVEASTGERMFLVADVPPKNAASAFRGLSRWDLVTLALLRFQTFQAVLSGVPNLPPPPLAALSNQADWVNQVATGWAAKGPGRIAVALAWPGFDDSGVAGWGGTHFSGLDGQPVCVRVASDFGGRFFTTTLASALASGADWLQVATWNDWNERTGIEPRWEPGYVGAVLAGQVPKRPDFERAFARAIEAQQALAAFKGLAYGPGKQTKLHRPVAKYLRRAATDPGVVQYD